MFQRLGLRFSCPRLRLVVLAAALVGTALAPTDASALICSLRICPLIAPACPEAFIDNIVCCRGGGEPLCFYSFDISRGCILQVFPVCP